jgi:1,4-alpha-glucan branching enzyme
VRDLNHPDRAEPALWELDFDGSGFWWIEANDADQNVFAFARRSHDSERVVVFVSNLSPVPRENYRLGLPRAGRWREVVNTDSGYYGGSDVGNLGGIESGPLGWMNQPFSAELRLPPLGTLWLVPEDQE